MNSLIDPDNTEDWAVRYVWIQNRFDNESFLNNYFNNGNSKNVNLRSLTTHINDDWLYHNKIFDASEVNGNLIWRVKVLNNLSNSIDIIEIWKNKDLINYYFNSVDDDTVLPDNTVWTAASKKRLSSEIYNTGFVIRLWNPPQSISRPLAIGYYKKFVAQSQRQENCIINTRFNQLLHI
jgi:hypothetical protein